MINFQIYKNGQQIEFEKNNVHFNDKNFQTLFIFHGLYGRGKNWQTFSKKISKENNHIVVTVDLRNHGGNDFEEHLSYILMMNDIISLFNYLSIEKTNLLGHSMGGKLAMVISLLAPKYVNKVIIADVAPINYENENGHNLIINSLLDMNLDLIKSRGEADVLLSEYIDQKFLRSFLLQNLELVDGKYKWSLNLKVIKKSLNDLRKFPTIKNINKFEKEVLCIYGGKSIYVKEEYFRIFKKFFSNIIFHEIRDADHFLHIENPLEFYEASNKFLNN
jgi:pimeloyl-ACP methyl ester carboxylesterase